MTEKELIDLGFRRIDVEAEEGISPVDWYYYEYSFSPDYDVLKLSAYYSNEDLFPRTGKEDDWYAELIEVDGRSQIIDILDVRALIDSIYKIIDILHKHK